MYIYIYIFNERNLKVYSIKIYIGKKAIGNVQRAENIFDRESLSILTNSTAD